MGMKSERSNRSQSLTQEAFMILHNLQNCRFRFMISQFNQLNVLVIGATTEDKIEKLEAFASIT